MARRAIIDVFRAGGGIGYESFARFGFSLVEVSRVEGDPLNAYYICRA
jgi:hypothetical protein